MQTTTKKQMSARDLELATNLHRLLAMTPEARRAFVKARGIAGMARFLGVSTRSADLRILVAKST